MNYSDEEVTLRLNHLTRACLDLLRRVQKLEARAAISTQAQPAQVAEPVRQAGGEALSYARNLAVALHAKHFPEVTQWKPLDDVTGLLTQIDNMVCGLVRPPQQAQGGESGEAVGEVTHVHAADGRRGSFNAVTFARYEGSTTAPIKSGDRLYLRPQVAANDQRDAALRALPTYRPVRLEFGVTMHKDVVQHEAGWVRFSDVLAAIKSDRTAQAPGGAA